MHNAELQPQVNSKQCQVSPMKFKVLFGKNVGPSWYGDIWMDSDAADHCENLRPFDAFLTVEAVCHL